MPDFRDVGPQIAPELYDLHGVPSGVPIGAPRYVKTETIKDAVKNRAADVMRAAGVPWHGRDHINCPYHDHPDRNPSWRVMQDGDRLVCTCRNVHSVFDGIMALEGLDFEGAKIRVAELLGRADLIVDPNKPRTDGDADDKGVTLKQLADAFMLPVDVLQTFGWFDLSRRGQKHDKSAVGIPYRNRENNRQWLRIRLALTGKKDKFRWRKGDVGAPLYGSHMAKFLPAEGFVVLLEGESDCAVCWHNAIPALGLPGADGWNEQRHAPTLDGVPIVFVIIEQDFGGAAVLKWLSKSSIRDRVRLVTMPPGIKDPRALWLHYKADPAAFTEALRACLKAAQLWDEEKHGSAASKVRISAQPGGQVSHLDFWYYAPEGDYIYMRTGEHWPGKSVDKCTDVPDATAIIDVERALHQKTWAPGYPKIIRDKLVGASGAWEDCAGVAVLNLYAAPDITLGDPKDIELWLAHLRFLYPHDWQHIVWWLAHRVQRPGDKINHVLVLGGSPGIGKDSLLQPAHYAVGGIANFQEISAAAIGGRFNPFLRAVILRINEARDFGEGNRFVFYEHMKEWGAAPPDFLRIDDKNVKAFQIANVVGIIITTNYKTDGLYIPADDRRHYVAWSEIKKEGDRFVNPHGEIDARFQGSVEAYFKRFYAWLESSGRNNVAAYFSQVDLSDFNPKASPPKTAAFWDMADASRPQEEAELSDLIDTLSRPRCVTVAKLIEAALARNDEISYWLKDRKNSRLVAPRMAKCGYEPVRNPDRGDGLWRFAEKRTSVYVLATIPPADRLNVVRAAILKKGGNGGNDGNDQNHRD